LFPEKVKKAKIAAQLADNMYANRALNPKTSK